MSRVIQSKLKSKNSSIRKKPSILKESTAGQSDINQMLHAGKGNMLNTITEEVVKEGKSDVGTASGVRGPRPNRIEKQPDQNELDS